MAFEINAASLKEVLEILNNQYGYDFSQYSQASLIRRVNRICTLNSIENSIDLKFKLINEKGFVIDFVEEITVNVTEMFRDPSFYKSLKKKVFSYLATYPQIRIWSAGCSTGEEPISLAIALEEAGLLHKCTIYATDLNQTVLQKAKKGIYHLDSLALHSKNYIEAGGLHSLSEYYLVKYGAAIFSPNIRKRIVYSQHSLVSDNSFNSFHLIVCRNVLIYFNQPLQNRAVELFYNSTEGTGFLALGNKESLRFTEYFSKYETIDRNERIFKKIL